MLAHLPITLESGFMITGPAQHPGRLKPRQSPWQRLCPAPRGSCRFPGLTGRRGWHHTCLHRKYNLGNVRDVFKCSVNPLGCGNRTPKRQWGWTDSGLG